jgi:dihydroorotate dehydrogenase
MTPRNPRDPQAFLPGLRPLTIAAPFGNYIQPDGCTATLGTFTVHDRPGRPWRILKTVRYYPRIGAWVNKIGLRNPGIGWVEKKVVAGKLDLSDKLVSVHGFNDDEWFLLLDKIAALRPMGVELNMSCPNVGHINWPPQLFSRAVATGVPVVVKLPPVNYEIMAEQAVQQGVRVFHACNTLPVPAGGLSGLPLKPVALQCIRDLRSRSWGQQVLIIGGGGIRDAQAIDEYRAAGADTFAVGTLVMSPAMLMSHARVKPLRERAEAMVP